MRIIKQPSYFQIETKTTTIKIWTETGSLFLGAIQQISPARGGQLGMFQSSWLGPEYQPIIIPFLFHIFLGDDPHFDYNNPNQAFDRRHITITPFSTSSISLKEYSNQIHSMPHSVEVIITGAVTFSTTMGEFTCEATFSYLLSDLYPEIRFGGFVKNTGVIGVLVAVEFPRLGPINIGDNSLIFFPWAFGNYPFYIREFDEDSKKVLRTVYPGAPWPVIHWSQSFLQNKEHIGATFTIKDTIISTKELWFGNINRIGTSADTRRPLLLNDQYEGGNWFNLASPLSESLEFQIINEKRVFFPLFYPMTPPGELFYLPISHLSISTDPHWAPRIQNYKQWQETEAGWALPGC